MFDERVASQAEMNIISIQLVAKARTDLSFALAKERARLSKKEASLLSVVQERWERYTEAELNLIDQKFKNGSIRTCIRNGTEELLIRDRIKYLSQSEGDSTI
jgi:hypothetical protein